MAKFASHENKSSENFNLANICLLKETVMQIIQEVGDDLSVCLLNLEFAELKSCFIRNAYNASL